MALDERVAAICIPASSSGLGVAQPVAEIGRLPRPEHCLLFVDAAQAAGRIPIGLDLWRADVVVAPARKWLRGPRGQAVMALSDRALSTVGDPPLLDQAGSAWVTADRWETRDDAARFESYEFSVAGRLGFGQALAHAERELPTIQPRIAATLQSLQAALVRLPHVAVFEDRMDDTAFLTFVCAGEAPSRTLVRLREEGVAIATVGLGYARLELESRGLTEVCRVSPHAYTTASDVDHFLETLAVPDAMPATPARRPARPQ
jgi:selenocysteine lyase/cysteine desulfurase